jgi:hypothetical protein
MTAGLNLRVDIYLQITAAFNTYQHLKVSFQTSKHAAIGGTNNL